MIHLVNSVASSAAVDSTPDTPKSLPSTPALFSESIPTEQAANDLLSHSVMPPEPSDPSQLIAEAGVPDSAPLGSAMSLGLIVCDPIPSAGLETFGSGCGRWLDLIASGQPELGRTPSWQSRNRAQQELGRTNFNLTPEQARGLGSMTGITHVACGTINGTSTQSTLTYSVYSLPDLKLVGAPITVSGTQTVILAALPGIAKTIDVRLGVTTPHTPAVVGLTPPEMVEVQTIGNESYISYTDLTKLSALSLKSPLAGMYYLNSRAFNDRILHNGMVKTLLSQLPDNPIPIYQGAFQTAEALWPFANQIGAIIKRYPANALLSHTDVWQQRSCGSRIGEWNAAKRYLADAPNDPDAWLCIGSTVGNVGEDIRQSRSSDDISQVEWNVLNGLYPQEEKADIHAEQLDPLDGHAWTRLATSATFQGDNETANLAMDKAIALDPGKEEVYFWGLQMYQSKWYGNPIELSHIADLATSEPWKIYDEATGTAENLAEAGFKSQSAQVLSDFISRQRVLIANTPSDAIAHWSLAEAFVAQNTPSSFRKATYEYRIAEKLMPGAPDIHEDLAGVLDARNLTDDAIAEHRKAVDDDPFDAGAHLQLGYDLKIKSQFPEALSELTMAVRLCPSNGSSHYALAELLAKQHQYAQAIPECREAIRMDYSDVRARVELCWLLDTQNQSDASLQEGDGAVHIMSESNQPNPELETTLYSSMADDYLKKKDWTASITESNKELEDCPNDAIAHENLAEAYLGEGNKGEARDEWQKTIARGDPNMTPIAQKFLADNP